MKKELSKAIGKNDLLLHPFYHAWDKGILTRTQIALYSSEWGSFLRMIRKGWQVIEEPEIAEEEEKQLKLWEAFAATICRQPHVVKLKPSINLLRVTDNNFREYASALGALSAFETPQAAISARKLVGLRKNYGHWDADERYFIERAMVTNKLATLKLKMNRLDTTGKQVAYAAFRCECRAIWKALNGITNANKFT